MIDQASDFLQQDFLKQYQALAQQAWEGWARQLQQPGASANPFAGFNPANAGTAPSDDLLARSLFGMKNYFDWMQGAAAGTFGVPNPSQSFDWRQQLQQLFGGASQPFGQAFAGIDSAAAQGFGQQWQAWLQAAQQGGFGDLRALQPMAPFGLSREQQLQQQALMAAVLEYLETSRQYQALLQQANAKAAERLQDKLAQRAEPGRQIESLKALYDLWVDAAEESYAEIALSAEFREVYGAMVNAQMRVRELQQQQTEQLCRELGIPTRSEVASLGQRLQEIRRELRVRPNAEMDAHEITALRAELAALKKRAQAPKAASGTAVKKAIKKAPAKAAAKPGKSAVKATSGRPASRKAAAKAPVRSAARKRK
jgi:polyhydroxyalkanoate synthase subunit PhaE